MRAVTDAPFPASYSDKVRPVGVINTKNRILTSIVAAVLDGPAALRRFLIDKFMVEGFTLRRGDDRRRGAGGLLRKAAVGVWHASCTCRMGAEDDPMAVTDPPGRVRGRAGLRVVDASIFPVVPCANTNFPTLMTAEKISAAMTGDSNRVIPSAARDLCCCLKGPSACGLGMTVLGSMQCQ